MAKYTNLTALLKAIADSIRNKKGTSATINAQDFPSEIDGIVLGSGNATTGDVLSGKTFSNDDGAQTGTMANNGAVSKSLGFGESYTVPQGYHNGSGNVSAKAPSGTISITSNGTKDVTNYASANVNVPQNVTVLWSAMNNIGSISDWNVPSGLSVSKNSANELVISKPASGSSYTMSYKTNLPKSYKGFGVLMYGNKTSAWYVGFNLQIAGATVFSQNFDSGDSTKGVNISSHSSSSGASVSITLNTQNNYDNNNSGIFRISELYLI